MLALKGLATVIGTLASRRPSRVITICFHILHRLYVEGGGVNLQNLWIGFFLRPYRILVTKRIAVALKGAAISACNAIITRSFAIMHAINFIQDLAVIMLVAGVVTILFHRLRQPVVLGYIVAGFIIGPHTPPFSLIHDEDTIKILAELGVIFLMFCLGLEFSLRKLFKVGATAFIAAFLEIALMIWIGYEIGQFFGWKTMDSLFLGAILAISSTTIIVKALNDLKMKNQRFAQLIFGVLIVEDILGIGIIALLSGIAVSSSVSSGEVFSTVGKLSLFMIVALVVGILVVPRLLSYVARFESNEMLLITVLGLCFGFCLLVVKLEYSMVLGAFLIGAIMAESRELLKIERLIEPVRDMFSAIFSWPSV